MAPRWSAFGVAAVVALIATVGGLGVKLVDPDDSHATETMARSTAVEFFRSQNVRAYDRTCRLLSREFYVRHRLPDRETCVASLRIGFMWSGPIEFHVGAVEHERDVYVVHAVADGAPGRIVLIKESGALKVLSVGGD